MTLRLVASHLPKKCEFLSKQCVTQNMQRTLSFASIFKFMSLYMHEKNKKLEYDKYATICTPTAAWGHRAPLCCWCHGESPLHVSAGLTRMAATPCRRRPFCSGILCGRGYGELVFTQRWTKIRPICSPRRSCACTDTFRTTGY